MGIVRMTLLGILVISAACYLPQVKRNWFATIPPGAENLLAAKVKISYNDLADARSAFAARYKHMAQTK